MDSCPQHWFYLEVDSAPPEPWMPAACERPRDRGPSEAALRLPAPETVSYYLLLFQAITCRIIYHVTTHNYHSTSTLLWALHELFHPPLITPKPPGPRGKESDLGARWAGAESQLHLF